MRIYPITADVWVDLHSIRTLESLDTRRTKISCEGVAPVEVKLSLADVTRRIIEGFSSPGKEIADG
jgi:hypothetical protein